MSKAALSMISLVCIFLPACKDSPIVSECGSPKAETIIKQSVYDNYGINPEHVTFNFDITTTESINKDTGARECHTELLVIFGDGDSAREKMKLCGFRSGVRSFNYRIKLDEKTKTDIVQLKDDWLIPNFYGQDTKRCIQDIYKTIN